MMKTSPCQAMKLATRGAWFRFLPPLALWGRLRQRFPNQVCLDVGLACLLPQAALRVGDLQLAVRVWLDEDVVLGFAPGRLLRFGAAWAKEPHASLDVGLACLPPQALLRGDLPLGTCGSWFRFLPCIPTNAGWQ